MNSKTVPERNGTLGEPGGGTSLLVFRTWEGKGAGGGAGER